MFDLDEKLLCDRFNSELIKHMKGNGEREINVTQPTDRQMCMNVNDMTSG